MKNIESPNGRQAIGLSAMLVLVLAVVGCNATSVKRAEPESAAMASSVSYPSVDAELGEHIFPNESPIADELSHAIEESIRKQYSAGRARRDAHPKAHGCVKAEIHVLETLPGMLAKGIFVPGKTYHAWIRFSNGSGDPIRAAANATRVAWPSRC